MKKRSLILGLVLCLIAVGGLAVVFRVDKDSSPSDSNSHISSDGFYGDAVEGIGLDKTNLVF